MFELSGSSPVNTTLSDEVPKPAGCHAHESDISWHLPVLPSEIPDDLEDLAVEAVTDAAMYRELLLESLAAAAHDLRERDRQRERYLALLDQYRALRAERVPV